MNTANHFTIDIYLNNQQHKIDRYRQLMSFILQSPPATHAPWCACPLPCMPPCHAYPPAIYAFNFKKCHTCLPPGMRPTTHSPYHACPQSCMPPIMHAPHHSCPLPCYPLCHASPPPRWQNSWHTLVKILPCHNFVAGGNEVTKVLVTCLSNGLK